MIYGLRDFTSNMALWKRCIYGCGRNTVDVFCVNVPQDSMLGRLTLRLPGARWDEGAFWYRVPANRETAAAILELADRYNMAVMPVTMHRIRELLADGPGPEGR